jgi:hypothetical protein
VDVYTEEDPMDLTALPDIGFAEFTTQLINDVFDGLVSQNIRQVQSYLELVEGLAATDKSYVESAYSDISDDQADVLLYKALPDTSESSTEGHLVIAGGTLTEAQADLLNAALQLPEADGGLTTNMAGDATADNKVAVATATDQVLDSTHIETIYTAAKRKLAYKQIYSLREMARMGMMRLVVDSGSIETRLTFTTHTYSGSSSSSTSVDTQSKGKTGQLSAGLALKKWIDISANTANNQVKVRTATERSHDNTGSHLQIYGAVKVTFKTDYAPLSG